MTKPLAPKTVGDLMAVTGLGEALVRAGIRSGALPGYMVGTRYVIPHEAFALFCEGRWVPQHRPIFTQEIKPIALVRRPVSSQKEAV